MDKIDLIFEKAWSKWNRRAEAKAMQDETYAAIEARRVIPGESGVKRWYSKDHNLGGPEWKTQMDIFWRINHRPWWAHAYHLYRHAVRDPARAVIVFVQRGQRGWADRDVYNLHWWLSRVIADSVEHFAANLHSHPKDFTPEQWAEVLADIVEGFRLPTDPLDIPKDELEAVEVKRIRARYLLAQHFDNIWD